jgi:hypothetical protein
MYLGISHSAAEKLGFSTLEIGTSWELKTGYLKLSRGN